VFARSVSFYLKPGRGRVHPAPRPEDHSGAPEAEGFSGRNLACRPRRADALAISVWDQKADAETCARGAYSGVLKALEQVVEGMPQVETYEVSNSTFHKIPARATA
jgi:hypothetical protein